MATVTVVKKTNVIASVEIGRMEVLNSCQEVLKAASYKSGGKKIRKTISGSSAKSGNAGAKPITSPTPTSKMGYGNFILSAMADKPINMAITNIII